MSHRCRGEVDSAGETNNLVVRDAGPTDAPDIARVQVASWHATYPGLVPDAFLAAFTVAARTSAMEKLLTAPGARRVWVGAIHGCACDANRCP